jgi:hypothetical protein
MLTKIARRPRPRHRFRRHRGSQAPGSSSDADRAASAGRHLPELRFGARDQFSE